MFLQSAAEEEAKTKTVGDELLHLLGLLHLHLLLLLLPLHLLLLLLLALILNDLARVVGGDDGAIGENATDCENDMGGGGDGRGGGGGGGSRGGVGEAHEEVEGKHLLQNGFQELQQRRFIGPMYEQGEVKRRRRRKRGGREWRRGWSA